MTIKEWENVKKGDMIFVYKECFSSEMQDWIPIIRTCETLEEKTTEVYTNASGKKKVRRLQEAILGKRKTYVNIVLLFTTKEKTLEYAAKHMQEYKEKIIEEFWSHFSVRERIGAEQRAKEHFEKNK